MGDYSYLTLEQRRKIEKMYAAGMRVVDIASSLKRIPAAIYEELKRGNTASWTDIPALSIVPKSHKRPHRKISGAEEIGGA